MKHRPIKKLLIANRGEIALRIIRACREMGIRSVAVFSDVDRRSLHVLSADEAYPLTGSTPKESYLNQDRILKIAANAAVDAIHPGYGFLAENPVFADATVAAGLIFIGPSGSSMRTMGDKTEARKAAKQLGVPTVSGTLEPILNPEDGLRTSAAIGFPVLLKAAAGGGGKGMRVVRTGDEFASAFRMAQSEAIGAFGDDRIYIEKYLDSPRHIEMQILADSHGNVVFLGERECSIQRRHQKVIEESPSVAVDDVLRGKLGQASVKLAKSARYSGAGTMEFLLDTQGNFYFLEMNTRLQVEHPVTEEITGIDLVKEQIRIAEGNALSFGQDQVKSRGHSIECRICAEDPANDFMPSTGTLVRYRTPQGRIRVENGFMQGDEISVYYDSLMAKLISWGTSREVAISAMLRALDEFVIDGVKSTIPFCSFVLKHEAFVEGNFNTRFIDNYFRPGPSSTLNTNLARAAAVAAVLVVSNKKDLRTSLSNVSPITSGKWKMSRGEAQQ